MSKFTRGLYYSLFLLGILSIFACQGGNSSAYDAVKNIPKDATNVTILDVGQILSKLPYEKIRTTAAFQQMEKDALLETPDFKPFFENPEEAGISLKGKFYRFSRFITNNIKDDPFSALIIPTSDKSKLDAFIQTLEKVSKEPNLGKTEQKENFSILKIGKNSYIAWNKEFLCIGGVAHEQVDAKGEFDKIFNPAVKKDEKAPTLLSNAKFKALYDQNKDFSTWINPDQFIDVYFADRRASREIQGYLFLFFGLSPQKLKGNSITSNISFENGKMEASTEYTFNETLKRQFGKVFKSKLDKDYTKYIAGANLGAVLTLGLNLQELNTILKKRKTNLPANVWLGQYGLTTDILEQGLSGELFLATYLPSDKTMAEGGGADFIFGLGIKNTEIVGNLTAVMAGWSDIKVTRTNQFIEFLPPNADVPFYGHAKGDMFIISSRQDYINKIDAGGFAGDEAAAPKYMTKIQEAWAGAYFDHSLSLDGLGMASLIAMQTGFVDPVIVEVVSEYEGFKEFDNTMILFGNESATATTTLKSTGKNSLEVLLGLYGNFNEDWQDIQELMLAEPDSLTSEDEAILEEIEEDETSVEK